MGGRCPETGPILGFLVADTNRECSTFRSVSSIRGGLTQSSERRGTTSQKAENGTTPLPNPKRWRDYASHCITPRHILIIFGGFPEGIYRWYFVRWSTSSNWRDIWIPFFATQCLIAFVGLISDDACLIPVRIFEFELPAARYNCSSAKPAITVRTQWDGSKINRKWLSIICSSCLERGIIWTAICRSYCLSLSTLRWFPTIVYYY